MSSSIEILARNILILDQFEEIEEALRRNSVPVILLKGFALIRAFPEYAREREMEDIDLLFRPGDLPAAREAFLSLGYRPVPEDPWAFHRPDAPAAVDIIDHLWYMDERENREAWHRAEPAGENGIHYLPPDEFYLHTLAHAFVHHASGDEKWTRDLSLLRDRWGGTIDTCRLKEKMSRYGLNEAGTGEETVEGSLKKRLFLWLSKTPLPHKGHLLRFILLPHRKKIGYLLNACFPSDDFLMYRYSLPHRRKIFLYRALRPLLLAGKFLSFCRSLART